MQEIYQSTNWHSEITNAQLSSIRTDHTQGVIQVLCNAFPLEFGPPPTPRNANNVEPYTFETVFPEKCDTPTPSALRDT